MFLANVTTKFYWRNTSVENLTKPTEPGDLGISSGKDLSNQNLHKIYMFMHIVEWKNAKSFVLERMSARRKAHGTFEIQRNSLKENYVFQFFLLAFLQKKVPVEPF